MKSVALLILACSSVLIMSSCQRYDIGQADVGDVSVEITSPNPTYGVMVHIKGYLGDGCTDINDFVITRVGDNFDVSVTTRRPHEAICTQILVSFEETVALGQKFIPGVNYTVNVNGIGRSFTIPG